MLGQGINVIRNMHEVRLNIIYILPLAINVVSAILSVTFLECIKVTLKVFFFGFLIILD